MASRTPTQVSQQRTYQEYLQQLDELLKRNSGSGVIAATDTSSNAPMYIPGKVRNASGLEENAQAINAMQPSQSVIPEFQSVDVPQEEYQPEQEQEQPLTMEDFLQQFEQSYNAPQNQPRFGGQQEGIGSTADGGTLLADGTINYPDGTSRQGDPNALAVASNADGGTRYSDGSIRKQAPQAISSMMGNRERIGYDDGSSRWGQYQYGANSSPIALPGGLQGLNSGLFGQNQTVTQDYGNYNPTLEPGSGYNLGTDFRTRDLSGSQRELKLPVGAEVVQVLQDDGTQWGDVSGHQGYGNSILVRLPTGEMLRFSHLSQMANVQPGQRIEAGQSFGTPGTTGNTQGEHLDLEYYDQNGQISNPAQFSGFSDPQGLRTPLPGQAAPGTLASNAPQVSSQAPQQQAPQQQESQLPLAAQAFTRPRQTAQEVGQVLGAATQPGSESREQLGAGVNALGQKAKLPEMYAGEVASGKVSPGQAVSYNIENADLTPRIDTGLSELARGDFQGAKQNFSDTSRRIGARVNELPGQIANALVPPAYADDGSPKQSSSLGQNLQGAANSVGEYLGEKSKPLTNVFKQTGESAQTALAQAGQGLKGLSSKVSNNIFKNELPQEQRAIGAESSSMSEADKATKTAQLADTAATASMRPDNDIRDSFFKFGGAETFQKFMNPGVDSNYKGALTLDLFNNDFFKDLGNVSSVFGGSKDLGAATDKFVSNERSKYSPMSRMNYEDGYDRGEVDNYNRDVDSYNDSLDKYFSSIPESVKGFQSVYAPFNRATNSSQRSQQSAPNLARPTAQNASLVAPARNALARPTMQNASIARPTQGASRPQSMSVARPAAMARPAVSLPPTTQKSVAPRVAPRPAVSLPPTANKSVAPRMSTPQMSVAPRAAQAPKANTNIFKKAAQKITNIFRR